MAAPTVSGIDDITFGASTLGAGQTIDAAITVTDADENFNGGTLVVSGLLAGDVITIPAASGNITFNGGTGEVSWGGTVFGVAVGGVGGDLTITFDADATAAWIQDLIAVLEYASTSLSPVVTRTLTFTLTDAAAEVGSDTAAVNIIGDAAANVLSGTAAGDTIDGAASADVLKGMDGIDTLNGDAGDDRLVGGSGDDILNGGADNDDLNGGVGADAMTGGTGNDTYTVDDAGDSVTENAAEGTDSVRSSMTYTLGANIENLTLSGTGNIDGDGNGDNNTITGNVGNNQVFALGGNDTVYGMGGGDVIDGGAGGDTLDGGNGDDFLYGDADNDSLVGGSGADYLNGGSGIDTMTGGTGDDQYIVTEAGDVVTELASQGTDTVQTNLASYTLAANVENLTGILGAKQTLNGNAERNTITGGAGGDIIDGKGDNDRITGAGGSDRMTGGLGADTFVILDSDMINSTVGGTRQADAILDLNFGQGDRVDLSAIDADINTGGDQAFTFVTSFSGVAGEARLVYIASSNSSALQLDVDGDGVADYQLNIKGGDFTAGPIVLASDPVNMGGWVL